MNLYHKNGCSVFTELFAYIFFIFFFSSLSISMILVVLLPSTNQNHNPPAIIFYPRFSTKAASFCFTKV